MQYRARLPRGEAVRPGDAVRAAARSLAAGAALLIHSLVEQETLTPEEIDDLVRELENHRKRGG